MEEYVEPGHFAPGYSGVEYVGGNYVASGFVALAFSTASVASHVGKGGFPYEAKPPKWNWQFEKELQELVQAPTKAKARKVKAVLAKQAEKPAFKPYVAKTRQLEEVFDKALSQKRISRSIIPDIQDYLDEIRAIRRRQNNDLAIMLLMRG